VTLSSAFLGLSMTFIKDILPAEALKCTFLLFASWTTLAFAIICTIASFRVSNAAIDAQLSRAHRYYLERDHEAFPVKSPSRLVDKMNALSGVLFILG